MTVRNRATAGIVVFLVLSFLGSWFVASTLHAFALGVEPQRIGTRLFTVSLLYALTMGWQPLVATWVVRRWVDPEEVDLGLRPSPGVFTFVGVAAAFAFTGAATALAWVLAVAGLTEPRTLNGSAEAPVDLGYAGWFDGAVLPSLALAGTIALVWIQAFGEEVGWRGYFLTRATERYGRERGLLLQGVAWGVWYAPVLFFSTLGASAVLGSAWRSVAFALTCVPIGALFGWLRIASRSIVPVVTANTTLTLIAGLPYVLHGVDAGLRSAIFGLPGWPILAGVGAYMGLRSRSIVRVRQPRLRSRNALGRPLH